MGQIQTIFLPDHLRNAGSQLAIAVDDATLAETARQIPGSYRTSSHLRNKLLQSVGVEVPLSETFQHVSAGAFRGLLAGLLNNFSPAMTLTLIADMAWVAGLYFAGSEVIGRVPNWAPCVLYLLIYLFCADRAFLYSGRPQSAGPQIVLGKTLIWATLLGALVLDCVPQRASLLPLLAWSTANWLVLSARRQIWRSFGSAVHGRRRNVLIIGTASQGVAVAEALRHDPDSPREVREFILDRSLREPLGIAMMRRTARRECIDEVIIATSDAIVVRAAVREAVRNQWDVSVVPDLHGGGFLGFECVGGLPMLKLREQQFPEYALALKRAVDVLLSAGGLIALSPLLLLIAILVKLESPGPVLYRAVRIGRGAAGFQCYKFRTMVRHAEGMKNELRSRNQRVGAFFKIQDDPRITRLGRFLRRYSLDELPQLWNVLVGDMSLVGPRPHPADDVENYSVEDLRRLDFVPGITGLWQITARRDPSFNRCVELDIEYITHWNVMLDLKILCRTVAAVVQGSGA
jgi:exopolysaccharide biosynthesis polyprenyl glycosylphosphotransferase